jgi:hypothetical protein
VAASSICAEDESAKNKVVTRRNNLDGFNLGLLGVWKSQETLADDERQTQSERLAVVGSTSQTHEEKDFHGKIPVSS